MLTTKQKLSLAGIAYRMISVGRRLRGNNDHTKITKQGITWDLNLKQGIDFSIYLLGSFEPELIKTYAEKIKQGSTVFDIGANIGAHTLPFAKYVGPTGQVHAFEATEYAYNRLQKNLRLNPKLATNVFPNHCYLASSLDTNAETKIPASWPLKASKDADIHESHAGQFHDTGNVVVNTIDNYVDQHNIKHIDWIKIDVDGNEYTILQGAQKTLKNFKPFVIIELAPECEDANGECKFKELLKLLLDLKYKFYQIPKLKPLPNKLERIEALIPDGASMNVLLYPG